MTPEQYNDARLLRSQIEELTDLRDSIIAYTKDVDAENIYAFVVFEGDGWNSSERVQLSLLARLLPLILSDLAYLNDRFSKL